MDSVSRVLYLNVRRNVRQHMMKLSGIRRFAQTVGWEVCPVSVDELAERSLPELFALLRPAGIIVECTEVVTFPLRDLNRVPCVFLSCLPNWNGNRVYKVYNDANAIVAAVIRELASTRPSGYAVIGYRKPRDWSRLRERGFVRQIAASGMRCRRFSLCEASSDERRRRLTEFLSRLPNETAIFAVNDETARETADAADGLGLDIPRNFTLVGVDNLEDVCESRSPSLSSVQIDFERAGYLAAKKLHEVMKGVRSVPKVGTFGPLFTLRRQSTRGFGRRSTQVLALIDFIRERACDGISVADVVAVAGASRRLVELRFRETAGHSIHDEIEQVRMDRVMQLLLDRTVSLQVVLAQSGYATERALRKAFRRRTGYSLLDWRAANAGVQG